MAITSMTDEAKAASAAAIAAANAKSGAKATSGSTTGGLNADFSFFLKMLTTQLTHQDPSEPMDTSQMTQQLATFSGVEQQVNTNTKLDQLISSNSTVTRQSQLASASNMIGREIETAGNTGEVLGGQGAFSYILPKAAASTEVVIRNSAGTIVYSGAGSTLNGRNTLLWDGKNSSTGAQMPDGSYTISVTAKDSAGAAITPEFRAVGIVAGFETDKSGNILLTVGTHTVKYDDVLTVRPATRADFSSTETETDTTADAA